MSNGCRFDSLREHRPDQCPLCNPEGWMYDAREDA